MALSPDDKLLGEKVDYYCSSSEDEGEDDDGSDAEGATESASKAPTFIPEKEIQTSNFGSCNTGPKGVIQDWRRFKQLEAQHREEQELERMQLAKKLTLSCRSHLDDEKEAAKDQKFMEELGELEDEFVLEYRQRRIEEMRRAFDNIPKFGQVTTLTKENFVLSIDQEKPSVTVIVHIYEDQIAACESMNGCLMCLAQQHPTVKFCKIRASDAKVSFNFAANGIPALLIYKAGELIGNFIRLSDDLGHDFFASDVQSFLVEHGMLQEKSVAIRGPAVVEDSDSDFDVD